MDATVPAAENAPEEAEKGKKPRRLGSLDALRGGTIALMLLVNNAAMDVYTPAQLQHAPWNGGATAADMVFPWFLFCAGLSIPFSSAAARARGDVDWRIDARVLFRAAALVALGILVQSVVARQFAPGLGVLGLIGLATLVAAYLSDLAPFRRAVIAALLLVAYGFALLNVPHSGGVVGLHEDRNLVRYLNREVLAPYFLAGLPSVVPTAALVLIGTLVAERLRRATASLELFGAGLAMVLVGHFWNPVLPYNKTVWTSSYILFAAGLATILLAGLHWMIDVRGWRGWAYPLVVFGSNPIAAYVAPILVKVLVFQTGNPSLQDRMLGGLKSAFGVSAGGWVYTIGYLVIWWLVMWVLYRKKWFLRV